MSVGSKGGINITFLSLSIQREYTAQHKMVCLMGLTRWDLPDCLIWNIRWHTQNLTPCGFEYLGRLPAFVR